jgi:hypothetical protein
VGPSWPSVSLIPNTTEPHTTNSIISTILGTAQADVALLAYAANPITEPALVLLGESFDRLIERAHRSICEDKISVFDQAQINSFIAIRSGKHNRTVSRQKYPNAALCQLELR